MARVRLLLLALLVALPLALPAAAAAGKRTVPHGFLGANWSFEIQTASEATKELAWQKMALDGVESQRLLFSWDSAQPSPHGSWSFVRTDADVSRAVRHGIDLLPVVARAPRWARRSDAPNSPPVKPHDYDAYLQALIERYGPRGSFWLENPALPRRPIRAWQIWNEPSRNYQWTIPKGESWAAGYGKLLRSAYRSVKSADPHAKVVLAGLPNRSWRSLARLYDKGHIRGYYDVGAPHPYTVHKHGVLTIVENYRRVMSQHGDGKKPIEVTELGLPASEGHFGTSNFELQTDDTGMARFLKESFADLVANRRRLNVTRINWFTWASKYEGSASPFDYSGLFVYHPGGEGPSSMKAKPALRAFRDFARRAEGCVKDVRGACAP